MQKLSEYITESISRPITGGGYIFTLSPEIPHKNIPESEFKKIDNDSKYIDIVRNLCGHNNLSKQFIDIIKNVYSEWKHNYNLEKASIPFRFNASGKCKLTYCYQHILASMQEQGKITQNNTGTTYKIDNKISIQIGAGLGGGGIDGLRFESEMAGALALLIYHNISKESDWEIPTEILNKYGTDIIITLKTILGCENAKKLFHDINSALRNNKNEYPAPEELPNIIKQTGASNNPRSVRGNTNNTHGLPDIFSEFEDLDNNNDFTETGKLISDITVFSQNNSAPDVFFSIKKSHAQLSGVTVSPSRNGIRWMDEIFDLKEGEVPDPEKDPRLQNFNNFYRGIGIDPDFLRNMMRKLRTNSQTEKQKYANISLKLYKNYNKIALGNTIQKIIGGNYWYVSPRHCFYVSPKRQNWKYEIESASITDTGRGIVINGHISGVEIKLVIRTDSSTSKYPNRFFPVIGNLENLISLME